MPYGSAAIRFFTSKPALSQVDGRMPLPIKRRSGHLPMSPSGWQWISASLLLACLASFGWAMQKFFVQPAGLTLGMRTIKACGIVFAILHLAAIVATPGI